MSVAAEHSPRLGGAACALYGNAGICPRRDGPIATGFNVSQHVVAWIQATSHRGKRKRPEASGLACGPSTGIEKCLENLMSIVFSRYGLKKYRQKYRHFSKCPRSAPRYVVGQNSAAPNRRKQNSTPASCAQPSTPKSKPPTSSKLIMANGFLHPRRSPTPHRRPAMHSSESTSSTESLESTATSPQQRYCLTPLLQQWHGDEALRAPLATTSHSSSPTRTSMALRSEVKPLSVRRPSTQKSG